MVLEQNPSKQGLKQLDTEVKAEDLAKVLEQNPPKQGLKLTNENGEVQIEWGFRAKSTKTRIETGNNNYGIGIGYRF